MAHQFPSLEQADILLSRSNSRASRVIVAVQALHNGTARASHTALIIDNKDCVEALWYGLTVTSLNKYNDVENIRIVRLKTITREQRLEIVISLLRRIGEPYGWTSLALFAMDSLFSLILKKEISWFSKIAKVTKFAVCSQAVAWAYANVTKQNVFGAPWQSVTPDLIDEVSSGPDWETVYQSPTW
ncbi:MAG: hypothetical protein QW761_02830 [Candidatus Aenigmatarchaeota archaeon]